mgnify:CR=1 FL=1
MIEVKFDTYNKYFKAYHWCREKWGDDLYRWHTNYGRGELHFSLLFRNKHDALLCKLMWP